MSVTRSWLRRRVGRLTRQMFVVKATSAGTTTTFVDQINLSDPSDSLLNRIGWVASGTSANLYTTIRVTDSDETTTTITFVPALASSTATNDEIELWNEMDQGIVPAEVHELIDLAIESVADAHPIPAIEAAQTFDKDSPVLDMPSTWRWFEGADWQDVSGFWHPIWERFLRVDEASRTVEILNQAAVNADTLQVRLRGSTRPSALSSDTSTTTVNAEYILKYCCYHVLLMAGHTMMESMALERWASTFKQEAEAIRMTARSRNTGMSISLPI